MNLYQRMSEALQQGRRQMAVLIDPDKVSTKHLDELCRQAESVAIDFFFVGGSLITRGNIHDTIRALKARTNIPIVIFPGGHQQIDGNADAILLLSLISGRNPEMLIGQHVLAAPRLKSSELEIIPTGYILVDGGKMTTVQYVSDTVPIPTDKPEIAAYTALAGQQLGLKAIFAEAGSGALNPVPTSIVKAIRREVNIPLIVGGGIRTPDQALALYGAGADVLVIGNHLESHPEQLEILAATRHKGVQASQ
ncbi:MAG: geranylgeranylglyceryl/heptaprenylglyceryl phosphate synthase [Bacteroidota bacterium]